MKFKDVELLPGVVVDAADPKMLGRIKVTVPGLFDSTQMSMEGLPWVYPITMTGYQGFSKLQNGSKVWVYKTEGNYREFWYMPMFEAHAGTREILSNYEEPDILIARSAGTKSVYLYYTDVDGIMAKLGDGSVINMKNDGEIMIKSGEAQVSVKGGKVYIGDEDADQQAVLGNKLDEVLNKLATNISAIADASKGSPYTSHLFASINSASTELSNGLGDNILATKTNVS